MCEAVLYTNLVLYCSDTRLVTCLLETTSSVFSCINRTCQVNPHEQINRMQPSLRCTVPLCSRSWSFRIHVATTGGLVPICFILGPKGQTRVRYKKRYNMVARCWLAWLQCSQTPNVLCQLHAAVSSMRHLPGTSQSTWLTVVSEGICLETYIFA